MNQLLEVTDYSKPIESFMDKLAFGGQMLLIGVATVFAVLALIWGCLVIFKIAFHDLPERRKHETNEPARVEAVEAAPVSTDSTDEIVAVIAAAIAAAESESSGLKFKVVSFKRK